MLKIDMWYGRSLPKEYTVDCFVNGNKYTGWIYDKNDMAIGDYWSDSSIEVAKKFGIDFGD